ncbi:hypothetical protein WCP94_004194 [Bilophila wadsworthia]
MGNPFRARPVQLFLQRRQKISILEKNVATVTSRILFYS